MKDKKPRISALMSIYNGQTHIEETMKSILNQSFQDFELVIIDDGSTDKTPEIIEGYSDQRIRLFRLKQNMGTGFALNYGLPLLRAEYFAKVDGDDINLPHRFEKQLDFLKENPSLSAVKSLVEYFPDSPEIAASDRFNWYKNVIEKQENSVVKSQDIREKMYWYFCMVHSTIMGKTRAFQEFGYRPFRINEDYDLFYRLNRAGHLLGAVEEVLVLQRVSVSSSAARTKQENFIQSLIEIKADIIGPIFEKYQRVFVWGAGALGRIFAGLMREKGHKIWGFVDGDSKKWGQEIILDNPLKKDFVKSDQGLEGDKMRFEEERIWDPHRILGENCGIIVASQPAKWEISDILEKAGKRHLEDYVILM